MAEERPGVERLFAFSDAVVAIAITLLVLPLADAFSEPVREGHGTTPLLLVQLHEHVVQIGAFLLSFVIIARVWWAHHRIGSHLGRVSTSLVVIDLLWVLTVVLVPVTTAITAAYRDSTLAFALYTGVLLVGSLALTALAVMAHRDPRTSRGASRATGDSLIGSAASAVAFAVALVVGSLLPVVGYWALVALALTPPFEHLLQRRAARRG